MKPILFNTEMVRAILDGRKTQTRRVLKPQPQSYSFDGRAYIFDEGELPKPQYQPGDILYVRETWTRASTWFGVDPSVGINDGYLYRADWDVEDHPIWNPSTYMPKEAARLFLRVTDVRVERLWDSFNAPITPILAVQAEGIDIGDTCRECLETYICPCCVEDLDDDGTTLGECGMLDENRGEFSDLWDSTIKPADRERYGWAANPWVWVICFERCGKEGVSCAN